jgi:ribosomal protein S27AE
MAILKQVDSKTFFSIPDEQLEKHAIPQDKLAAALKDAGITLGTSTTPEEIKGKKVLHAHDRPAATPSKDASAQFLRQNVAVCPNCYASNVVWEETTEYRLFQCGGCGYVFRF